MDVNYGLIRNLFPDWNRRKSIAGFLSYYSTYEFMSPTYEREIDMSDQSQGVYTSTFTIQQTSRQMLQCVWI